jgi:hypothetical protein
LLLPPEGAKVSYDAETGPKGLNAANVQTLWPPLLVAVRRPSWQVCGRLADNAGQRTARRGVIDALGTPQEGIVTHGVQFQEENHDGEDEP